jgi:hypothetical protein
MILRSYWQVILIEKDELRSDPRLISDLQPGVKYRNWQYYENPSPRSSGMQVYQLWQVLADGHYTYMTQDFKCFSSWFWLHSDTSRQTIATPGLAPFFT